ncbi:MAG: hypothetical protein JXX29_10755 [Deltaproteobacteria bacterium]|nr:hypothetical protein [Deltaproteobacteria bacterium]MBN2672148.1 hypothetical protein [Deltaproteobacteria bacterium]
MSSIIKKSVLSAFFIRNGISLHLFSSVCLAIYLGTRLLATVPAYEIQVSGRRVILHDPWLIQPIGGLGIRIGLF